MDPDGDYESRHSTRSAADDVNLAGDDIDVESPSKIFLPNEDTKLPAKPTKDSDTYEGATAPPMEVPPLVAAAAAAAASANIGSAKKQPRGTAYEDMMTGKMDLAASDEAPISNSVAVPIGFDSDDMALPEAKALPIISSTANEETKMPTATSEEVQTDAQIDEQLIPVPVLPSQPEAFDDGYNRTSKTCPSQCRSIDNCTTLEPNEINGTRKSHDDKSFCKKSLSVLALPYDIITWVIIGQRSTTDNEGTTMPAATLEEVPNEDTEAQVDEEDPTPVPVPSSQEDDATNSSSSDGTDTAAEQEDKSTSTTKRCTRKREWRCCCAIAFLAVVGTVLGVLFGTAQGQLLLQGYRSCNLDGHVGAAIGNGHCDSKLNNDECGWDGGDCLIDGYPNCHVEHPEWIGDSSCTGGSYNTAECGWDGGDCVELNEFNVRYPNCQIAWRETVGNGWCSGAYNTEECGWDGGDCLAIGYPNCHVVRPDWIGDGTCDGGEYNTAVCGWDGGDCLVSGYPDCHIENPNWIGDGQCNGGRYNTAECGWDGGDCFSENYPNCKTDKWSPNFEWIADGLCNGGRYNTAQCGWDGGDCQFHRHSNQECVGIRHSTKHSVTYGWCQNRCIDLGISCEAYDFSENPQLSRTGTCRIFGSYYSPRQSSGQVRYACWEKE